MDQSLRVWDQSSGAIVRVLDNHTDEVRDLAPRPRGEGLPMIASAAADRTVRLWQPTIGRLVRFARLPADLRDSLAVDRHVADESRIAAAIDDGAAANDQVMHVNSRPTPDNLHCYPEVVGFGDNS